MMATGPKIPYARWLYGRSLMHRLRNGKHSHSLTEVSRLVKGNGDTPGWAASAIEHRGVMGEKDIEAMEKILVERPSGIGRQPGDLMLNTSQRDDFKRLLKRLRHEFGWSKQQIAAALGYGTLSAVDKALSAHGGGTVAKLTILSQIVNTLATAPPEEGLGTRVFVGGEPTADVAYEYPDTEGKPHVTKAKQASGLEAQLSVVRDSGYAFLEELMKLEEFLRVFAKAPLLDYQRRVEEIITELGQKR